MIFRPLPREIAITDARVVVEDTLQSAVESEGHKYGETCHYKLKTSKQKRKYRTKRNRKNPKDKKIIRQNHVSHALKTLLSHPSNRIKFIN